MRLHKQEAAMSNGQVHSEKAFEDVIEEYLLTHGGYLRGDNGGFSRELVFNPADLLAFLRDTQARAWKQLGGIHGPEVEKKFIFRLTRELDARGLLDCLRNGVVDYGVRFHLCHFAPVSTLNPETAALYAGNRLHVYRQLKYSPRHENTVDMVIAVNGLPVVTMELKNQFTGQTAANAKKQYIQDRDPNDLLFQFKKRALVHFSMDTDEVWMTTRVAGKETVFLPFNQGHEKAAGNPPNPNGHRTAYLWEQILARDSLLDLLGRYLHLERKEVKGKERSGWKETLVFPRYHQRRVVRRVAAVVQEPGQGPGKNYLVQHSAGSGKSHTIAWLAHRLASLHNAGNKLIYDVVVIVTDRLVLDQQLQDIVYQIEHKTGVVEKIDKDSQQLAAALKAGKKIIITTLQKFPFVLDQIECLPQRTYAVIADEAHSSQAGEAALALKEALGSGPYANADEEENDAEAIARKRAELRGPQPNMSFFAFTATPKAKTLELFGVAGPDGKKAAFDLYSMRQAIEEKFILDVLRNYTTYKTFYRLAKAIEDDPQIEKRKAIRAIGRFLLLHPTNLAQKTAVMVEHFRSVVKGKIGGKAKGMVVTSSRLHAVRYKQEFDRYLKDNGYTDIKALVAFSGVVDDGGLVFTEPEMNGFSERELPRKFDDVREYRLLLVADKYQTGFDQPLLHTMYVDKRLAGVKAVQTLSRLNRVCPGKEDCFVLDFLDQADEIRKAFQEYYEDTMVSEATDPNQLHDLHRKIEESHVYLPEEVENFAVVFFKPKEDVMFADHAALNRVVDPAVDRFKGLEEDKQEEFRGWLGAFVRLYAFLSQIMPFSDVSLEKLYAYGRFLERKLPQRDRGEEYRVGGELVLEYYRLQKISEGAIPLQTGATADLKGPSEVGTTRKTEDDMETLSAIIKLLNQKFGTDFTDADALFLQQVEEDLAADQKLVEQAQRNTRENFRFGFEQVFLDKLIGRMDANEGMFTKLMDDEGFARDVKEYLLRRVYRRLNAPASPKPSG
jgi:type I restriction enzyme R subunit